MKPSKYEASCSHSSSGSTCATYWSGRTTTMHPASRSMPRMRKDVVTVFEIGAEHLFVVMEAIAALSGQ